MCLFALIVDMPTSQAEFELNFEPDTSNYGDGGRGGSWGGGGRGGGEWWEFWDEEIVQEMVFENGQEYYHVIIKDPYQDFAMDFYIQTASGNGFYPDRSTGPASASYGDGGPNLARFENPYLSASGNGTGTPDRIYMRQIFNDGTIQQDFNKATLSQKPIITQSIVSDGYRDEVVINMDNSNYSQMDRPGSIDIHAVVTDLDFPFGEGDFLLSRDGQQVNVTAGQFTYEDGSGDRWEPGGSNGTYTYADGDFDVYDVDWLSFCESDQNPQHHCNFDGSNRSSRGGHGGW